MGSSHRPRWQEKYRASANLAQECDELLVIDGEIPRYASTSSDIPGDRRAQRALCPLAHHEPIADRGGGAERRSIANPRTPADPGRTADTHVRSDMDIVGNDNVAIEHRVVSQARQAGKRRSG